MPYYLSMPRAPKNSKKRWAPQDVKQLKNLAKGNTPTGLIAYELGRSEAAVYAKASDEGVSLKPTNQSPYNRRTAKK